MSSYRGIADGPSNGRDKLRPSGIPVSTKVESCEGLQLILPIQKLSDRFGSVGKIGPIVAGAFFARISDDLYRPSASTRPCDNQSFPGEDRKSPNAR